MLACRIATKQHYGLKVNIIVHNPSSRVNGNMRSGKYEVTRNLLARGGWVPKDESAAPGYRLVASVQHASDDQQNTHPNDETLSQRRKHLLDSWSPQT